MYIYIHTYICIHIYIYIYYMYICIQIRIFPNDILQYLFFKGGLAINKLSLEDMWSSLDHFSKTNMGRQLAQKDAVSAVMMESDAGMYFHIYVYIYICNV